MVVVMQFSNREARTAGSLQPLLSNAHTVYWCEIIQET